MSEVRHIVGCVVGPSLDGIDVALVRVEGNAAADGPDALSAKLIAGATEPLGKLRADLYRLVRGLPTIPGQIATTARRLGERCAEVIPSLLQRYRDLLDVDFVATMGPAIAHDPKEHLRWALMDPWPIVQRLGTPVVHDFAGADLAAGGQGAPLSPIADRLMFPPQQRNRLLVKLHAIASVTYLPADGGAVDGFDIGPCNALLDAVVHELHPDRVADRDGRLALRGEPSDAMFRLIMKHPFFKDAPSRAASVNEFGEQWIEGLVQQARRHMAAEDLIPATTDSIAGMLHALVQRLHHPQVVLTGGGALNPSLVDRIRKQVSPAAVLLSRELGVPENLYAPMNAALLGALSADGVPISLPRVTHANNPGVAGAWVGQRRG